MMNGNVRKWWWWWQRVICFPCSSCLYSIKITKPCIPILSQYLNFLACENEDTRDWISSRGRMASTFVKPTPWHTIVGDSIELRLRQCEIELETWLLSWNTIIYFLAHGNFPLHCLILQYCQKGPKRIDPIVVVGSWTRGVLKGVQNFQFSPFECVLKKEIVSRVLSANFGDIIKVVCLQRKCHAIIVILRCGKRGFLCKVNFGWNRTSRHHKVSD